MGPGRNFGKAAPPEYCDDFLNLRLQWMKVTTYNREQHKEKVNESKRVVQIYTLTADSEYTGGK
jgi:hypothetical protein